MAVRYCSIGGDSVSSLLYTQVSSLKSLNFALMNQMQAKIWVKRMAVKTPWTILMMAALSLIALFIFWRSLKFLEIFSTLTILKILIILYNLGILRSLRSF